MKNKTANCGLRIADCGLVSFRGLPSFAIGRPLTNHNLQSAIRNPHSEIPQSAIRNPQSKRPQAGASLLEMITAITVLTIGLLGAAASIAHALRLNTMSRNATNAKFVGVSMLEQGETLRNTRRLTFGQIANMGAVNNSGAARAFAGFATGFQPAATNPGPDGIYGTADDLRDAGPDGIYGTADDFDNPALVLEGYTRRVVIEPLSATLKKITVTVRYPGSAGNTVELTCLGYLNDDYQ